jgi:hypothetical protein
MNTPFIFSTATSMNDLREPAIAEEDEQMEKKSEQNVDSTVAYAGVHLLSAELRV